MNYKAFKLVLEAEGIRVSESDSKMVIRACRKLDRYNEFHCSGTLFDETDISVNTVHEMRAEMYAKWETIRHNRTKDIERFCKKTGLTARIQQDPRGRAVGFLLPSGRHNSWDGETFRP